MFLIYKHIKLSPKKKKKNTKTTRIFFIFETINIHIIFVKISRALNKKIFIKKKIKTNERLPRFTRL